MLGAFVIIIVALLAVIAPLIAPLGPVKQDLRRRYEPPSAEHILGTDSLGRDLWARLIYGGRVSMTVGIVAVAIYVVIGTGLGAISGYLGGWIDIVIQRVTETVMTFPTLMIILTVVSLIGPSIYNVFLAIGLLRWPAVARLVRGEVLSLRERDFALAAHSVGARHLRILSRHILPNVAAPVIVAATLGVAHAILVETSLSFLGLGVQPPTPSWGNMIAEAQTFSALESMPWIWLPPGIAISACVLGINFIGDGLRDALDPRMGTD
jgi:peptide/nickel transport system permease protein